MDDKTFNKFLFVRNNDDAFKVAIMFSRYEKISLATQEMLFFANKDGVKHNFNALAFTEMYNETLDYVNNWMLSLDTVKDEHDWQFHRTRLLTRFITQKNIHAWVGNIAEHLKVNNPQEAKVIKNASVMWDNANYHAERDSYNKKYSEETWELWDILKKYKHDELDKITGTEKHLKEFRKIVKYRDEDNFYKEYRSTLNDNSDLKPEIDEVEKNLSVIFFRDKLEKEIPIITSIRRRLKI